MNSKDTSDLALLGWLLKQARPYWLKLASIFGLRLLATPLALLVPVPLMVAVDSVIGNDSLPSFLQLTMPGFVSGSRENILALVVMLVVIIAILSQLRAVAGALLETYVGQRLVMEFRSRLLNHAQRLSATYHDTKGTADTVYRIQYDTLAAQSLLVEGIAPFFTSLFTLVSMLVVMYRLDGKIAMIALAVSPALVIITVIYRKRLRAQWKKVKRAESSAQSVVHEVLGSLRVVQAFGRETHENDRFMERSLSSVRERLRAVVVENLFGFYVAIIMAMGTGLVLYIGVKHVQSNIISVGQLLLVMSYLAQLYTPLKDLGRQATKLQSGFAGAERAYAFLKEPFQVAERPNASPIARAQGAIAFEHVSFSYDGVSEVIKDVNFSVSPGTRVGIAGHTGAGKSTLTNLMMRFYDPVGGRILLDGCDLRDYRVADLRNQFSLVLQDTVLFSASIADNIAYGRPNATPQEIVEAAKIANADEFIRKLPDGYDTLVGERGMRLSGGERQRISLARAFLKDAPILILDEPTSSVDIKTEAAIMTAMQRLMQGRTTFMIAHRLSTLEICDVILEVENGRLAQADVVPESAALPVG